MQVYYLLVLACNTSVHRHQVVHIGGASTCLVLYEIAVEGCLNNIAPARQQQHDCLLAKQGHVAERISANTGKVMREDQVLLIHDKVILTSYDRM